MSEYTIYMCERLPRPFYPSLGATILDPEYAVGRRGEGEGKEPRINYSTPTPHEVSQK
jgi:hypothetical protein